MMYVIPNNKLLAIRRLAKDCANYESGECIALDCNCVVQQDSVGIICKYYMKSVLPVDPKLHQEVLLATGTKDTTKKFTRTCKDCGLKFKAVQKQAIYCEKCQKKALKDRHKKYNSKRAKN